MIDRKAFEEARKEIDEDIPPISTVFALPKPKVSEPIDYGDGDNEYQRGQTSHDAYAIAAESDATYYEDAGYREAVRKSRADRDRRIVRNSRRVADMEVGDWGYTVPWMVSVLEDRTVWINGGFSFCTEPGGTYQLPIERRENGWYIGRNFRPAMSMGGGRIPWGDPAIPIAGWING